MKLNSILVVGLCRERERERGRETETETDRKREREGFVVVEESGK